MRLLEAADDLGAKPLRTFLHVALPLTKAGILSGCLLVFVPRSRSSSSPTSWGEAKSY